MDGAALAGIVDPFPAARETAAAQFGVATYASVDEVIDKVDAAIVASPTPLHADTVALLLSAGKHVLVEKPITTGPNEADELVRLAKAKRRVLQVGHVERFNPAWTAAADVTADAKYIEAVRASRFPGRCLDVGVVLDLMIHDIDLVLSLTDAPLRSVHASGIAVVSEHEDMAEARLEFQCGLVANLKASRISPAPSRQLKSFGPNGFAEIDFSTLTLQTVRPATQIVDRSFELSAATDNPLKFADTLFSEFLAVDTVKVESRNAILDELHDFVISIQSKSEPTVTGHAGKRAVEVAAMILESISQRSWTSDLSVASAVGAHATPTEAIQAASRRIHAARRAA